MARKEKYADSYRLTVAAWRARGLHHEGRRPFYPAWAPEQTAAAALRLAVRLAQDAVEAVRQAHDDCPGCDLCGDLDGWAYVLEGLESDVGCSTKDGGVLAEQWREKGQAFLTEYQQAQHRYGVARESELRATIGTT